MPRANSVGINLDERDAFGNKRPRSPYRPPAEPIKKAAYKPPVAVASRRVKTAPPPPPKPAAKRPEPRKRGPRLAYAGD